MTALLDEHPHLGVECVLRELHIASSTYYRWRRAEREPCEHQRRDAALTEEIARIHTDSGGIYGSPRVHAVLKHEGVAVGRKRVERLMRQADLAGISPRRTKGFTRRDPTATPSPDLVNRDFTAPAPNRLWVTDLTMIPTDEGPLWLSAIRDAFSRRVVAWETSARADADLVLSSLEYALASREPVPGSLIHHADHGCQYPSMITGKLQDPHGRVLALWGACAVVCAGWYRECACALAGGLDFSLGQTHCMQATSNGVRGESPYRASYRYGASSGGWDNRR
ncbi:IS3 family transposase [Kitasatospora purpeofusca]|uniref:IS3 family transposase n=1 Tax=Kitasatospora purpeofusca TaxID=67352 RepID=UPI00364DC5CB